MTERQIQDGLCAYLRKNHLSFVRNRMDKKSCIREGWPDVTVIHCGRAWLCELKTPTGKISAKQKEVIAELRAGGTPVTVARSVESALGSLLTWLGVVNAATGQPESRTVPSDPECPKSDLWIAPMGGKDWVFRGDYTAGGICVHLRPATPSDLASIRRR